MVKTQKIENIWPSQIVPMEITSELNGTIEVVSQPILMSQAISILGQNKEILKKLSGDNISKNPNQVPEVLPAE